MQSVGFRLEEWMAFHLARMRQRLSGKFAILRYIDVAGTYRVKARGGEEKTVVLG